MHTQTAIAQTAPALATEPLFHRIWQPATIAFGLGLTAAWACFLGYGLVTLMMLAL